MGQHPKWRENRGTPPEREFFKNFNKLILNHLRKWVKSFYENICMYIYKYVPL